MNHYLFDTMIFNKILDGKISLKLFNKNDFKVWVTHVQLDELNDTVAQQRRNDLIKVFESVLDESIPTSSARWGISKWGEAMWPKDDICDEILSSLNNKKMHKNNSKDSLIADTAIKNKITLVTDDENLFETTREFGGYVINFSLFLETENLR